MTTRQINRRLSSRPALGWLLLGLLLLAQLSWASHFHEADEAQQHDCVICTQLHNINHASSGQAALSLPAPSTPLLITPSPTPASTSACALRPQSRAPPLP